MRERDVEAYLVKQIKALGGMCEKFVSPGKTGVPDRLIILPAGRIIFCELKAPGKKPTELQLRDHQKRRDLGCEVLVIDSIEEVDAFTRRLTRLPE